MATPLDALQNRSDLLKNNLSSSPTAYAPNTLPSKRDVSTDTGTYQFDIQSDYGDTLTIKKNDSFSIIGSKTISTENILGIDKNIKIIFSNVSYFFSYYSFPYM